MGNTKASRQPVSTKARDRPAFPENLETRQQQPSATSARASHKRLSNSSIENIWSSGAMADHTLPDTRIISSVDPQQVTTSRRG